jgi:hypothetical protein
MRRFMNGVNRTWPHAGHRLYNTAKPGSIPEYFSACLLDHLPPDVDLVVLEFGVNSRWEDVGPWARLMRRVMRLESQPAVRPANGRARTPQSNLLSTAAH